MLALVLALTLPARALDLVLYTVGPGDDLFSHFGHASLCVEEQRLRGSCFNYGTADFSDPVGLTWDFFQGRTRFFVSTTSPRGQLRLYEALDRTVYRQVLPFDEDTVKQAFQDLRHDALPENREYRYHHYLDNCSTRLRDHLDRWGGGALARASKTEPAPTFRAYTMQGFSSLPPLQVLAPFALGRVVDQPNTRWGAMFHPDELRAVVSEVYGAPAEVINERTAPLAPSRPVEPWIVLSAMGLGLALVAGAASRWGPRIAQALVGLPLGLLGTISWTLALISTQTELRHNEVLPIVWGFDLGFWLLPERLRARYIDLRLIVLAGVLLLGLAGLLLQPWVGPWALTALPFLALRFSLGRADRPSGGSPPSAS